MKNVDMVSNVTWNLQFYLHLSPTKQHFDSMKNIDMVSTNVTWSLNFLRPPPSLTKQQYVDI